ncbi:MAG: response regulator, partial [Acidimicrobiia bacterium]
LPVAGVTEPVESVKEREHVDGGHETVLVCEDESGVRDLVCRILQTKGYQVLSADRPSRAIEMARSHQGSIDLLLTDVVMPEMKGPELAEALRNVTPVLHILYVSGYTENILDQHGINTEGVAFLHKPFSSRELLRHTRTLLDQRGSGGHAVRQERARSKR